MVEDGHARDYGVSRRFAAGVVPTVCHPHIPELTMHSTTHEKTPGAHGSMISGAPFVAITHSTMASLPQDVALVRAGGCHLLFVTGLCRELVCGTVASKFKVLSPNVSPTRPFSPRSQLSSSETDLPIMGFDSPSFQLTMASLACRQWRIASYLPSNEHQTTGVRDVLAIGLPAFAFPRPMPRPAKEAAMAVGVYF